MTTGIIYLVGGGGYAARLVVSVWSLRKTGYKGPITLFSLPAVHEIAERIAEDRRLALDLRPIRSVRDDYLGTLATKTNLPELSPYDVNLFIDADTAIAAPVDALLEATKDCGLLVTPFADWKCDRAEIQDKCRAWAELGDDVACLVEGLSPRAPVINTGVFGFHRDFEGVSDWRRLALLGLNSPVPDEMAMQLILPQLTQAGAVIAGDDRWNCSPRFGTRKDDAVIWHFHNNLHLSPEGRQLWQPVLQEVVSKNVGGIGAWGPQLSVEL